MALLKLMVALSLMVGAYESFAAGKKENGEKADVKEVAKDKEAAKEEKKEAENKTAPALSPEEQAAAEAKLEKERQALLKSKKPMYNKIAEVKRVAKILHQPVLVMFIGKGTPGESMIKKMVFQNKLFMKDFALKNFVFYKFEIKFGPSKENPRAKEPMLKKLKEDEKKLIEIIFDQNQIKTPFVTIMNEDLTESLFRTSGHRSELPQFSEDLPLQTWMEALLPLMESKKMVMEVSPAVRKFIETPIKEKGAKKKK